VYPVVENRFEIGQNSVAVILKSIAVGAEVGYNGSRIHTEKQTMSAQHPSGRAFLAQPDD